MASHIRRRTFLATLLGGGAAVAWPVAARSQQTRAMRRIGVLTPYPADDAEGHARLTAFAQALQQSGWTVGQNALSGQIKPSPVCPLLGVKRT